MPFRLRSLAGCALVACLSASSIGAAPPTWPLLHGRADARVSSEHRWAQTTAEIGRFLAAVEAHNRQLLLDAAAAQEAARAASAARARESEQHRTRTAQAAVEQGSGRCGGDLPPCYVMMRESRGSLTAENPVSSASGKWQFLDGTWGGYGGYAHASDAPESVQDARAREVWAGGAGCSAWSACG